MPSFDEVQSERARAQQAFQQLIKAVPRLFKAVRGFIEQTELSQRYQETDTHRSFTLSAGVLRYTICYNHSELRIYLPNSHGSMIDSFILGRRQSKKHRACHLDLFYTVKGAKPLAGAFGRVIMGAGTITAQQPEAITCTRVIKLQPKANDSPLYLKCHTQQNNFRVLKTFHHRSTPESTLNAARYEAFGHSAIPHTHAKSYQDDQANGKIWFNIDGQPQLTMRYLGQPVNPLSYVTRAQKLQAFVDILQTYMDQIFKHKAFHLDLKIDNFLRDKRRGNNARDQYNIVDLGRVTHESSACVHATHGYIPAKALRYRASFTENNQLVVDERDDKFPSALVDQFALAVIIEELLGLPESYLMIDLTRYNYDLGDEEDSLCDKAAHSLWVQNGRHNYGFKWEDYAYDFSYNDIKVVKKQLQRLREEEKDFSILLPGIIAKIQQMKRNSARRIDLENEQKQHLARISSKIDGFIQTINKFRRIITQSGGQGKLVQVLSQLDRLHSKYKDLHCTSDQLNLSIQLGKIIMIECFVIFHQLINLVEKIVCAESRLDSDFHRWYAQQHDYLAEHGTLSPALMRFVGTRIKNKAGYCMVFAQGRLSLINAHKDNPDKLFGQSSSSACVRDDTRCAKPVTAIPEDVQVSTESATSRPKPPPPGFIKPVSSADNPLGFFHRIYRNKGKIALATGVSASVGGGAVGAAYGIMLLLIALGAATGLGLPVAALALSAAIIASFPTATATTIWYGHSAAPAA